MSTGEGEETMLPHELLVYLSSVESDKVLKPSRIMKDGGLLILDTGSPVSLMGTEFLDSVFKATDIETANRIREIIGREGLGNGPRAINFGGVKPVLTCGEITLWIRVADYVVPVNFLLVPGPVPGIMGLRDQKALGMLIDTVDAVVTFKGSGKCSKLKYLQEPLYHDLGHLNIRFFLAQAKGQDDRLLQPGITLVQGAWESTRPGGYVKAVSCFPVEETSPILTQELDWKCPCLSLEEEDVHVPNDIPLKGGLTSGDLYAWEIDQIPMIKEPMINEKLTSAYFQKYVVDLHVELGHSSSGPDLLTLCGRRGAAKALREYQSQCHYCKQRGRKPEVPKVKDSLGEILAQPFEIISMDILVINELPWSHLLHIVDHSTRFSYLIPLHTHTGEEVARAFILRWVLMWGKPKVIIIDRGPDIKGKTDLGKLFLTGVLCLKVPSQAHWKVRCEAHNRTIRRYLELALRDSGLNPSVRLDEEVLCAWVSFLKNTAIHRAKGKGFNALQFFSPYLQITGYQPVIGMIPSILEEGSRDLRRKLALSARRAEDTRKLLAAQQAERRLARRDFVPGQQVWAWRLKSTRASGEAQRDEGLLESSQENKSKGNGEWLPANVVV